MSTAEAEVSREAWLKDRQQAIGASESPAICGVGYAGQNAWTIWAHKVGRLDAVQETESMRWGLRLQDAILDGFAEDAKIEVCRNQNNVFQRSHDYPFLGATLDGWCHEPDGSLAVVECKNVSVFAAREWKDEDDPPLRVNVQCQHQMLVAGAQAAYVVGLVGGNRLLWRRVERSETFLSALVPVLSDFWRLVETKTPPEVDASEATARALFALYPEDDESEIDLPAEASEWDDQRLAALAQVKHYEAIADEMSNRIKAALGPATFGRLPGGGRYKWATQHVKEHLVRAHDKRVLYRLKK